MAAPLAARPLLLSLTLLALAPAGAARAAEVRALGGTYDEQVRSIQAENGAMVVRTDQRSIPLDQIKSIRFQEAVGLASTQPEARILLTTGDWVVGSIQGGDDDGIDVRSRGLGDVRLPLDLVRAVLPGASPDRPFDPRTALDPNAQTDRVVMKGSGTARGTLLRIDARNVVIEDDRMGELSFALAEVELVAVALLGEPPAPPAGLRVQVGLVDGSRVTGQLESLVNQELKLRHPLAKDRPLVIHLPRVQELAVQNGAFVYLSDIEPLGGVDQKFPPGFTYEVEVWGYKRDREVTGGPLRLGGRTYDKGLGVHSYAALSYQLDGQFKEFKAIVGLDDTTRYTGEPGFGAIVFKVLVDGRVAREYPSGVVQRKGQEPTAITVDVTGARTLTLVADFDPVSLHILGRGDWADAHLIRAR